LRRALSGSFRVSRQSTPGDIDSDMAETITIFEKTMGFPVMGDYPLMKYLQQLDDLRTYNARQK